MKLKKLKDSDILNLIQKSHQLRDKNFKLFAMYSSLWKGFTTDPKMMMIPIDDHIVHRGDGAFETLRIVHHSPYDLDTHLKRLQHSLNLIGIELPNTLESIKEICLEMIQNISSSDGLIRLFVSRGPGGFTLNPQESIGAQLYIVITNFHPLPEEMYQKGVKVIRSRIPVKSSPFQKIKSCNYLQNVLMKKEALDNKVHFALSFTKEGYLSEGASENVALISKENELLIPSFDYTLQGTIMMKVMKLAQTLIDTKHLSSIRVTHIPFSTFEEAKEVFLTGTTLEVLSVSEFEGKKVGNGQVGIIAKKLRTLLQKDMKEKAL